MDTTNGERFLEELRAKATGVPDTPTEARAPASAVTETDVSQRAEELAKAKISLERAYDITLEALGDALELHDTETEHHSKRVTAFSMVLARAMGLPAEKILGISRGAYLHDIGKIGTPPPILRKAGALTPEELQILREHCDHGYQMLRKIPFLAEAAEIVYAHHENWDGTGYPRRLAGDAIPMGARIVAVINALDAMTTDQPYHSAHTVNAARDEIIRWSGRQFDPAVVKMFLTVPESLWQSLRNELSTQLSAQR